MISKYFITQKKRKRLEVKNEYGMSYFMYNTAVTYFKKF